MKKKKKDLDKDFEELRKWGEEMRKMNYMKSNSPPSNKEIDRALGIKKKERDPTFEEIFEELDQKDFKKIELITKKLRDMRRLLNR